MKGASLLLYGDTKTPPSWLFLSSGQYRRGKAGREEAVKGKGNNEQSPLIPKKALAAFGRGAVMGGI